MGGALVGVGCLVPQPVTFSCFPSGAVPCSVPLVRHSVGLSQSPEPTRHVRVICAGRRPRWCVSEPPWAASCSKHGGGVARARRRLAAEKRRRGGGATPHAAPHPPGPPAAPRGWGALTQILPPPPAVTSCPLALLVSPP